MNDSKVRTIWIASSIEPRFFQRFTAWMFLLGFLREPDIKRMVQSSLQDLAAVVKCHGLEAREICKRLNILSAIEVDSVDYQPGDLLIVEVEAEPGTTLDPPGITVTETGEEGEKEGPRLYLFLEARGAGDMVTATQRPSILHP